MLEELCEDIEVAPDAAICIEYGYYPIQAILYTKVGKPLAITPAQNKTPAQLLSEEIARRLALPESDDLKIYEFPIKEGQIPFGTPDYKTDPQRNVKVPNPVGSPMKIEWTDYRNNNVIYDYYGRVNDGKSYLGWGKSGQKLYGGLKGFVGSFTAIAGVINGAEMNSQMKAEFNWLGDVVPPRADIL